MHHFESMPSLHISSMAPTKDPFPTSPPASPLSYTSTPSLPEKSSRHRHRRSLAISQHLTFPPPLPVEHNPAMITPPLSSPALSFPKTSSLESLRSGNTLLDYDSDVVKTSTLDEVSLRPVASLEALPSNTGNDDVILPDAQFTTETSQLETASTVRFRKVAFNDSIIYYPPRPLPSRQASFSSQISQQSSREGTPIPCSPGLSHRRSLSSFLLPSPTFITSSSSSSQRHTRERKSWAGLIASPFAAARRRRSPNRYRPPTPPLGYVEERTMEAWPFPPTPIIDLDAALGPFKTPSSPLSVSNSSKFWSLTSHIGTHRRTESAPEIRGLGLETSFVSEKTSIMRGLKRKMSVIDEEEKPSRFEKMDIDSELDRIILQEGEEMGEMGELVVDQEVRSNLDIGGKLPKSRSWRKSLKEWWRKV